MVSINPLWVLIVSLVFALVPIVVGVSTSYLKLSIVFGMLKSGLGTQQVPGALVTMVLSLAMTLFIMGPVIDQSLENAEKLSTLELEKGLSVKQLAELAKLIEPWRDFLKKHAGARELRFLAEISPEKLNSKDVEEVHETGLRPLLLAFILTELKESFAMGFLLLLPFLVIDLIIANILAGLGMFMVSPVLISLPVKLLLFVIADGWLFLSKNLILSYQA